MCVHIQIIVLGRGTKYVYLYIYIKIQCNFKMVCKNSRENKCPLS